MSEHVTHEAATYRDLTERVTCQAAIVATGEPGAGVNRALADALAVTHRVRYRLLVADGPASRPPSPEEKLLRAIFGEAASPEEGVLPEQGARLERGAHLIQHPQHAAVFREAVECVVEETSRSSEDLPAGFKAELAVIVRWPGPLTRGDVLRVGNTPMIVERIVDDGAKEPRVYLAQGSGTTDVIRILPSAAQSLAARAIGPYDEITRTPLTGEVLRDDQLEWLVAHGGHAIISDAAAYRSGDPILSMRVYEGMVALAPFDDPWRVTRPPAPVAKRPSASTATPGDTIFALFDRPKDQASGLRRVELLSTLAAAASMRLDYDDTGVMTLVQAPLTDVPDWSYGEIQTGERFDGDKPIAGGLHCGKIFGPTRDYECVCGKYTRMKHRGVLCEICGVEVIQSRVRNTRFGHLRLPAPITPRGFTMPWHVVPVLPAGLRKTDVLDELYRALLARRGDPGTTLDQIVGRIAQRIVALLCEPRHVDYSARATAIVGTRNAIGYEVATELFSPLLLGLAEKRGFVTTLKHGLRLLDRDRRVTHELLAQVLHDRVVLLAHPERAPMMVAAKVEVVDDPIVELEASVARALGIETGDDVSVHAPISDAAQHAAKHLVAAQWIDPFALSLGSLGFTSSDTSSSWVREVLGAPDPAHALVAAAARGASDPCTWPPLAYFVGGYPSAAEPPPRIELGTAPESGPPPPNPYLDWSIDRLELSVHTANCLARAKITALRMLVQCTESDLLAIEQLGRQSLREIKEILAAMGLTLGMKID